MFFRSEPKWEVVEPLKDIGWRIRKKYFLMKIKNQPKERLALSWASLSLLLCADLGPDKYLSDKDLQCAVKLLSSCSVLKFLHDKGFPYGHLHASNVMLDGDTCRLLDLENSLLGLPSFYRSYFTQFRKINTLEAVDVHCFGHLLYEMTYGRPPDSVPVDSFPPAPSMSVVTVLESILSPEAMKNGMPTVSRLLQMPLFSDVLLTNSEKTQFKIPTKLKEALKIAKECIEKRLVEEQKLKSKRSAFESGEEQTMKYSNSNNSAGSGASSPLTSPSSPVPPFTAAGASTIPSPPPPPAVPPLPPNLDVPTQSDPRLVNNTSRGALLSSIQNFQKGALKKTETCDYSAPRIS
ncbi:hypothetical protein JD844_013196 [Phrynosoma platyrhinos]|uniref:WH2 domain-containing protein n=1 Tax=Phrynosoma platyrhinos TaxID=52577 RepID=A0ABQ7TKS2_PHRPL|nr:hypothetical protein JD844_013196 [Phrynosoma platyrhinos]